MTIQPYLLGTIPVYIFYPKVIIKWSHLSFSKVSHLGHYVLWSPQPRPNRCHAKKGMEPQLSTFDAEGDLWAKDLRGAEMDSFLLLPSSMPLLLSYPSQMHWPSFRLLGTLNSFPPQCLWLEIHCAGMLLRKLDPSHHHSHHLREASLTTLSRRAIFHFPISPYPFS